MSESLMSSEIRRRMRDSSEGTRFEFDPGFTGFEGHFPGRPILPGVVLIRAAEITAAVQFDGPVRLTGVRQAKFFRPVQPGEAVIFNAGTRREGDRAWIVAVSAATPSGDKVCKIQLELVE